MHKSRDLKALLSRLQEEEYPYIASLCAKANACISALSEAPGQKDIASYTGVCSRLTVQTEQYMRLRRLVLVPYIHDLVNKEEDGHDCRSCSGNCSVRHADQNRQLKAAHSLIRSLLYQLQAGGIPAYHPDQNPEALRSLRTTMLLLDAALSEVIFIEESELLPEMIDLQEKIGAHD